MKDGVIEFVIKCRDKATAVLKGAVEKTKSAVQQIRKHVSDAFGGEDAAGFGKMGRAAMRAIPAMMALDHMMGAFGGTLGKVASGIKGVVSMAMAFGPVGAAVSGVMLLVEHACNAYAEAQQKALDRFNEFWDAQKARIAAMKENHYEAQVRGLADLERQLGRTAAAFEAAERRRERLARHRKGLDDVRADAELQGMRRDMSDDLAGAPDEERGRVAAAWRLRIAEREAELKQRSADIEAESDADAVRAAAKRERLAWSAHGQLRAEANERRADYENIYRRTKRERGGVLAEQDPEVKRYKALAESAEEKAAAAEDRATKLRDEVAAAKEESARNAEARALAVVKAQDAARSAGHEYDRAERDYAAARQREADEEAAAREREVEEEERLRLEMERRVAAERSRRLREDLARAKAEAVEEERSAQARLAAAQSAVRQAWGWYRNKDSMAAQIEEEKADAEAKKQYEKDFERLRTWKSDWRTAKNLSVDEEAVRRVALAREEEKAAGEYARQTAEASARAADALEAIRREMSEEA